MAGTNEKGYDLISKKNIIFVDRNYLRPLDVNTLLGNAAKARKQLLGNLKQIFISL